MQVFVKTLDGTTVTLDVAPRDTVDVLKAKLCERVGVPPEAQSLVLDGKPLLSSSFLSSSSASSGDGRADDGADDGAAAAPLASRLRAGTTLTLSLRLPGGLTVFTCAVCKKQMVGARRRGPVGRPVP